MAGYESCPFWLVVGYPEYPLCPRMMLPVCQRPLFFMLTDNLDLEKVLGWIYHPLHLSGLLPSFVHLPKIWWSSITAGNSWAEGWVKFWRKWPFPSIKNLVISLLILMPQSSVIVEPGLTFYSWYICKIFYQNLDVKSSFLGPFFSLWMLLSIVL